MRPLGDFPPKSLFSPFDLLRTAKAQKVCYSRKEKKRFYRTLLKENSFANRKMFSFLPFFRFGRIFSLFFREWPRNGRKYSIEVQ